MRGVGKSFGVAGILAVALSAVPVSAQDGPVTPEEGPWRLVLKAQLKQEKGCDLNEVLMYQEIPLGDDVGVQGKVSCHDNRQFDFSRNRKHQKFRIELCQPTVC
ncbi:hypothetical protein [Hyphomicrobium sp. LHD-15]|uniref:hypothetical protein n=1 Tax=Hyphomicrobium sp. LHD-15 TaxID=3072142 RepID=UPI00280D34BA|nr:hypothetical protein [Hyphomicrobium sp. LHD-15]MDQ8700666.1 hypothetical protein [Hyphomicrobium sp. LHD-15]